MLRFLTKAMPTVALSRISSCSASARSMRSSRSCWRVMSSKSHVGALPFGDVLAQPDVALRRLARRDRPAGDAAPEARAVLAAHPGLARMHLAAIELGVGLGHLLVFRLGEIDVARRRADGAARRVAEHLLDAAVTAHRAAIARELDADHDVVEERLLLGEHALQLLLGLALFGDVFDDPDGAFMRLARIDGAAIGPVPEGAAVLAPAQLHAARGLAARERLVDFAALLVACTPGGEAG